MDMDSNIKQSLRKLEKSCTEKEYIFITKKYVIYKGDVYIWKGDTSWIPNETTKETILRNLGLTNEYSREEILSLINEHKGKNIKRIILFIVGCLFSTL